MIEKRDDERRVVADANSTPYGLAATVWTENLTRAHRVAEQIAAGTVWINCWMLRDLRTPFGGMRQSGIGRDGLHASVELMTEEKTVMLPNQPLAFPKLGAGD